MTTIPQPAQALCDAIKDFLVKIPDLPREVRESANNFHRTVLKLYTLPEGDDRKSAGQFQDLGRRLSSRMQPTLSPGGPSHIGERKWGLLNNIMYAVGDGRDSSRYEEELWLIAGSEPGLEDRIHKARLRGQETFEERARLNSLIEKGLDSEELRAYWRELPVRAPWFRNKAGKQIHFAASKQLYAKLKRKDRIAMKQWLSNLQGIYGECLADLVIPEEVAPNVKIPETGHCLLDMEPADHWHVYIDESGMSFSADEPGSEGRMVAVCMPEKHLLPPKKLHCTTAPYSSVRQAFVELLESPCGIFGLSRDVLAIRGTHGWEQMLCKLVKWVWRLLPLAPDGGGTKLSVHVEQRSDYSAKMREETFRTVRNILTAELNSENPKRAEKVSLLTLDFVDKSDPRCSWADVAAYCWGSPREEVRRDLKASRLLDSCLVRLSPDGLSLCQDILEGRDPDMDEWTRLLATHAENLGRAGTSPLTDYALRVLADRCRRTPALLKTYTQAMNNYLLSREYELPVLEAMAEWLAPFRSDDPVTRYFWCLSRLAHLNHRGDPCSGELSSVRQELVGLLPTIGAIDSAAELQAALRLAVADANAFAFEQAEARLARWNPDGDGTLTGTALWDGKILSSLGQYRAFQGDLAGACRLFGQAVEKFGRMPEEMAARQLPQTRTYLAVAAMDRKSMDDAAVRALVEEALGESIPAYAERALRDPLKDRYGHYLLARYLSKRGSAEERASYLRGRDGWTREGTGFSWGHPWPIIQYHRWLLTDREDVDLRRGIADSLAACIGESRPTVVLIVCAIALSMGLFDANDASFRRRLLELEDMMPESGPIVRQLMASDGRDELLAARVLPFNYC